MNTFWQTLETGLGLDIILWLQNFQNPLFDGLATLFHYLGSFDFCLLLVVMVYWAVNRRLGVRLLFLWLVTLAIMDWNKALLARPRPYVVSDQVVMLVHQDGYGIPSGHTMLALVLWGYMAYWVKSQRVTIKQGFTLFAIGYTVIMGWSRMYLGVHYPQDVAAGLLLGGLILWSAIRYGDAITRRWEEVPAEGQLIWLVVLCCLTVLMGWLVNHISLAMIVSGLLLGAGIGLHWAARHLRYEPRSGIEWRILNFLGGLIIALVPYAALEWLEDMLYSPAVTFIQFMLIGLILTAVWPWLSVRLKLAEQSPGMTAQDVDGV